jgi:hypothetical protein
VNSIGLISAQWPSPEGKGAPAPVRWQFCEKGLGFLANWRHVLSLFRGDTDDLQKSPLISIPSQGEVHDGVARNRTPASTCTGRLGND